MPFGMDYATDIKKGDRIEFDYNGKTYRATVECRRALIVFFEADDPDCPISWIDPKDVLPEVCEAWKNCRKLDLYRGHSLDYLRSLPVDKRPSLD